MKLRPVTESDAESVRKWRNEDISTLRTPFMLSRSQQKQWLESIHDRNSNHRYYSIMEDGILIGVGGLTYIQWENRICEISLILSPEKRGMGFGKRSVDALLAEAFDTLNMKTVFGEVYMCGPSKFWEKLNPDYMTILKNRKYCKGRYYDSMYFSWSRP